MQKMFFESRTKIFFIYFLYLHFNTPFFPSTTNMNNRFIINISIGHKENWKNREAVLLFHIYILKTFCYLIFLKDTGPGS